MTKKRVLISGFIGLILIAVLFVINKAGVCQSAGNVCNYLLSDLSLFWMVVVFFSPLIFLFSGVTFLLKDSIFRAWIRFSIIWIPLTLVLPIFAGPPQSLFISGPALAILALYALYISISVAILITQSIRVYWLKNMKTWMAVMLVIVIVIVIMRALLWGAKVGVIPT